MLGLPSNVTAAPVIERSLPLFVLHYNDPDNWMLDTIAHPSSPICCLHAVFCIFKALQM